MKINKNEIIAEHTHIHTHTHTHTFYVVVDTSERKMRKHLRICKGAVAMSKLKHKVQGKKESQRKLQSAKNTKKVCESGGRKKELTGERGK